MKKLLSNPGFESIFALSLAAIIGLPPLVLAQDKKKDTERIVSKHVEVRIKDGDTTINGKNLKYLKGKDREEALSYMPDADGLAAIVPDQKARIIVKRRNSDGKDVVIERRELNGDDVSVFADNDVFVTDSLGKNIDIKIKKMTELPTIAFDYNNGDKSMLTAPRFRTYTMTGRPFNGFGSRNTQNFNYNNVDNEGISTNISYSVSDAVKGKNNKLNGIEENRLDLKSINLAPDFSTGNTTVSFTLDSKTAADVQFKDSQGKILWTGKASAGKFTRAFSLPLNGVYYLQVKQGSKTALKRIVKED
ncbi:T9SS type A sorting domain-containing protein [Mucilaginibacter sp. JRF]|uniref:T9SS type A sorting domain-containing protein n=1 Tax=Mucilaginibacter sp. JRF TaxID=2780088 RepID=UPI001882D51B|nr:T9SS type A sorting domain-containing protein [Mucilaginibacter sp. JRF]MBE9586097.1 T9SS type A sorting domain-containing protein [Mucilaginibacter sp. JRF]